MLMSSTQYAEYFFQKLNFIFAVLFSPQNEVLLDRMVGSRFAVFFGKAYGMSTCCLIQDQKKHAKDVKLPQGPLLKSLFIVAVNSV